MPPRVTRSSTKAASTSKGRKRERSPSPLPPSLPWEFSTPEQAKNYRRLSKREVVPSKFLDSHTIHILGFRKTVNVLLENMGWEKIAALRTPTYDFITYEILSTLYSDFESHNQANKPSIFFRCLGKDRSLTMQQFNTIFGLPNEGITWNRSDLNYNAAWSQLTDQSKYNPRSSKASFFNIHALRYIHCVMALSIFGRGWNTGVVNKTDLLFLWGMANGFRMNTGLWLLKHLLHVAQAPTGKICVGGLLTVIAQFYGYNLDENLHLSVGGGNLVDTDTLISMRICRHTGRGHFKLLDDMGHILESYENDEDAEDRYLAHSRKEARSQQAAPKPKEEVSSFQAIQKERHPDWLIARFERLEKRMTRIERFMQQMLEQLQQQTITRAEWMEEKLDRLH